MPADYASFMETVGGGWRCPYGLEWSLLDAAGVARATAANFRLWVRDAEPDEPPLDPGLWLSIGWFSAKHEYVLCCDLDHPDYGVVVDGHASHPWLNGLDFGGCFRAAPSFQAWLKR